MSTVWNYNSWNDFIAANNHKDNDIYGFIFDFDWNNLCSESDLLSAEGSQILRINFGSFEPYRDPN